MTENTANRTVSSAQSDGSSWRPISLPWRRGLLFLPLAALAFCWLGFLRKLSLNWGSESYYSFGWYVPVLAGFLGWVCWRDFAARDRSTGPGWLMSAGMLSLVVYIPFRLMIDLNPFWRFPLWGGGVLLVLATWLMIWRHLGLRVAFAMLFPTAFLITMIPWPAGFERVVIDTMTKIVVAANSEILRLLGYPAESDGTVIVIGRASVGVDDACSGIRSLQTLGMLALFIGEYWRLPALRRGWLIVIGAVTAFFFNVMRALALALCVVNGGQAVYERWHDPAGYISLSCSVAVLIVAAICWSRPSAAASEVTVRAPVKSGPPPRLEPSVVVAILFLACGTFPELAPALWYRDSDAPGHKYDIIIHWSPLPGYDVQPLMIDERVREILGFDFGERDLIRGAAGTTAEAWSYGFDGKSASKSLSAFVHAPTVCMTANGATLIKTHERLDVDLGPFTLPFEHYTFASPARSGGQPIQVFWSIWDGSSDNFESHADLRELHFRALLGRRRSLERKVILVGFHSSDTEESRKLMTELVRAAVVPSVDGHPVEFGNAVVSQIVSPVK